jgi:uncharacterized protein (TIGR02117 family)
VTKVAASKGRKKIGYSFSFIRYKATRVFAALVVLFALLLLVTTHGADPALFPPRSGQPSVEIVVADHGIHVALILPRPDLASIASEQGLPNLIAVTQRFGAFDYLEFGWGDETVYRLGRPVDSRWIFAGLRALLGLNDNSVMFVGGYVGDPALLIPQSRPMRLRLSKDGLARLATLLEQSFASEAGQPVAIGPGIGGPSLFYRATGHYSLLNVCNHWTAMLLRKAGVPVSFVPDTLSQLLMLDLRLRAGAKPAADF